MAYSNTLPRTKNLTGADLTGTDGTADRTYTIPDSGVLTEGIDITINGTTLFEGSSYDFTLASTVLTFLNIVDDTDIIRINYFIALTIPSEASLSTSTSLKYATPIMLAYTLGIVGESNTWTVGESPSLENVGTGDGSTTIFYLDQRNILSDEYSLYYGATEATKSALTETTHYVMDGDSGKITLTTAGLALVATNYIYAEYKYIKNGMANSYLITVLSRAEKEVDKAVNSTFTDGTNDNPSYPLITEIRDSEGIFMDRYISNKKPLIDVTSTLSADITAAATTLAVATGAGASFPSSGYLLIGSEIITYTGISTDTFTGLTRGALGTTAAVHSEDDVVHTTILMLSDTVEGSSPTYTVQQWGTDFYATEDGLFYIYDEEYQFTSNDSLAKTGVPNRVKMIYLYGYNTVPGDITRLTLLYAKRMLIQDNIGKALLDGRNEFKPEMFNVDREEIENIIGSHIVLSMGNT